MENIIEPLLLECITLDHADSAPAQKYFGHRGLSFEFINGGADSLAFHRGLPYFTEDRKQKALYPAIVAFCKKTDDSQARIESALRIYLTSDGHKAPENPCKKAIGPIGGKGCLIGKICDEMIVGEGLETTIAACQSTGMAGIAVMSANNLRDFQPHAEIRTIHILVDKDRSGVGEKVATELAERCVDLGLKVYYHLPPSEIAPGSKGIDWADELLERGNEFINQRIRDASLYSISNMDSNLVTMADVEREDVEWIVSPFIPRRKVTFLEGDPGLGKSFITLSIASAISTGALLSNGLQFSQGKIILFCTEDGLGDTVRPRLEKMDADLTQITAYKIPIVLDDEGKKAIENGLRTQRPELVILDPLSAFLSVNADINKANHARQFMSWLAEAAARFNCAILIIRHLTKGGRDQAIYRGLGSIDFTAAARSVLMVAGSPNDKSKRAIFHTKSNLAPFGDPLGYEIADGKVIWTGKAEFKLEDFLNQNVERKRSGITAEKEAADALKDFLKNGPKPQREVIDYICQDVGVSKRTICRAKKALGIISVKEKDKQNGEWIWRLSDRPHWRDFTDPEKSDDPDYEEEYESEL